MTDNTQSAARWYMVTHDGVATLCEDLRDAEKEAKDADMAWPHSGPHRAVQLVEVGTAAAELRRQHARIAELEAQIEAGGVSGPLMGQPQAMPDLSALTERGAQAWAGVDAQELRGGGADISKEREDFNAWLRTYEEEVGAIDEAAAWAGFSGARASLAASAGSEPVATIKSWTNGSYWRNYKVEWHRNDLPEGAQLYTHPSPPEGMVGGWISVKTGCPNGRPATIRHALSTAKRFPRR